MKTLLIDTHALLWWLTGHRRLPEVVQARIADPETRVLVSAVCAWEIAIKRALGKLEAPDGLLEVVEESGLEWVPVEPAEAFAAGGLPLHHRDPFDRLLVAQAMERSTAIVSQDEMLERYGVERLWR